MVEIYQNTGMNKRGKWSLPKFVLKVDKKARKITVPGKAGRRMNIAVEDISLALPEDSFENAVQVAIDKVDEVIECVAEKLDVDDVADNETSEVLVTNEDADFSGSSKSAVAGLCYSSQPHRFNLGERLMVYWPDDDTNYAGTVKNLHRDGSVTVLYDDGQTERLNMDSEVWH